MRVIHIATAIHDYHIHCDMTCISNQSVPKCVDLSFGAIGVVCGIDCLLSGGVQQVTNRPNPALKRMKRLARLSFGDVHKQGLHSRGEMQNAGLQTLSEMTHSLPLQLH